jgi:hypothetical protein
VIRGRDDLDKDLIIAQDYITDGIRLRAAGRSSASCAVATSPGKLGRKLGLGI